MLIDNHVHVTPNGKWFDTTHDASVESLLAEMDLHDIHQAVLLPIAGFIPNNFIVDTCMQHPDRFIAAVSVDPNRGRWAVSELRDHLSEKNIRLLKLHPRLQNFDPLSRNVVRLLEVCVEFDVPALFDCFPFDRRRPLVASLPLVFDKLAKLIPSAKIILAHAGGHRVLDACMVAKSNENIFLDISYTPIFFQGSSVPKDLAFALKKVGARKVLYGSDYPEVRMGEALTVARWLVSDVPEADQDLIFGRTVRELLRLGEGDK